MGCDIHAYVEYRDEFSGDESKDKFILWWRIADLYLSRSYQLFAHMAGVRNRDSVTPVSEPKGLPKDVSSSVKYESNLLGIDGHDHSWLSLQECRKVAIRVENPEFLAVVIMMEFLEQEAKYETRLVFWFDN